MATNASNSSTSTVDSETSFTVSLPGLKIATEVVSDLEFSIPHYRVMTFSRPLWDSWTCQQVGRPLKALQIGS